jgi:carboxylesterase
MTRAEDWLFAVARSLGQLRRECSDVFVVGLSMGGTLALRLAELHPEKVRGVVLVNPSIHSHDRRLLALPVLRFLVRSVPGVINDIKLQGQDEKGDDRMPLDALYSLTKLWSQTSEDLTRVQCPVLVFGSTEDHVVEPTNSMEVVRRVGSPDVNFFALHDSYHVATLDNDAPLIVEQSLKFVERCAATSDVTSAVGDA